MDENPYESPAEIDLEQISPAPPSKPLAFRIKRITQIITLGCAVLYFLFRSRVLPAQDPIVLQLLLAGSMIGLVLVIACNYFIRPTPRGSAIKPRHRLRVK